MLDYSFVQINSRETSIEIHQSKRFRIRAHGVLDIRDDYGEEYTVSLDDGKYAFCQAT